MAGGFIAAIIGGLLGVAGFTLFQAASDVIARGEFLWGMGWLFLDINYSEASMYQMAGIAIMVVGGIILLFGLVTAFRKR